MYVEQSYFGPDADFTKSQVDGHWELQWDFNEPLPKLNVGQTTYIAFTAWGKKKMGEQTFSGEGLVTYAAFQAEETESYAGDSGPASFGLYDITVTVGNYTYLVNVGITEEGELVVRSWQVQ